MDNRQHASLLQKQMRRAMQEKMLEDKRHELERREVFFAENKDAIDRRYKEAEKLEDECWESKQDVTEGKDLDGV
jgi:hypothetical protein